MLIIYLILIAFLLYLIFRFITFTNLTNLILAILFCILMIILPDWFARSNIGYEFLGRSYRIKYIIAYLALLFSFYNVFGKELRGFPNVVFGLSLLFSLFVGLVRIILW